MEHTLQHMDAGLVLLDAERRVVSVNAAAARLLGRDAAALLGAGLDELHPPASRAKVELLLAAAADPAAPAAATSMVVAMPGRVMIVKASAMAGAGAGAARTALLLLRIAGAPARDSAAAAGAAEAGGAPAPARPPRGRTAPLVKLPVTTRRGVVLLDPADAVYVRANGHYTTVHTADGAHFCALSLSDLEDRLDGRDFVRSHRGYLVNLRHARALDRSDGRAVFVMAAPGEPRVPVSRGRIEALKALLAL